MAEQWHLSAETARRLGVSPKALRVYERVGLVTPLRTSSGWRTYGPDQMARLHQILALKGLGLSLKRVGELLDGRLASLDAVLDLQQRALEAQRSETDKALALLAAARSRLARRGALSADDIAELTRETIMTKLKTNQDWADAFGPLIEKHYEPEEISALVGSQNETHEKIGLDQAGIAAAWEALFEEARALRAIGDTTSSRARDLVRRWREMIGHFTKDPAIERKAQAVWSAAMSDPAVGPRLPISPEDFAFVQEIADGMRARGALPPRA